MQMMQLSIEPDEESRVKGSPMLGFTRFVKLAAHHHSRTASLSRAAVYPAAGEPFKIMIEASYERSAAAAICLTGRDAEQLWTMLGTLLGKITGEVPADVVPGFVLRTDGTKEPTYPAGGSFTLEALYALLDTDTIETIKLADGRLMILDENGLQNQKLLNPCASVLASPVIGAPVRVVGDVVVCPAEYLK